MEYKRLVSFMLFVRGPTVSREEDRGKTPSKEILPNEVFNPINLFQAEGILTDPPVSVPMLAAHKLLAKATPDPAEDPPETLGQSFIMAFSGILKLLFVPSPPKANSTVDVFPNWIRPDFFAKETV